MRVNKPQPFDPAKEYKPGERLIYQKWVLIATPWTRGMTAAAIKFKILATRCGCCKISHEDCTGIDLKCWRFNRTDRKEIYFKYLNHIKKPRV